MREQCKDCIHKPICGYYKKEEYTKDWATIKDCIYYIPKYIYKKPNFTNHNSEHDYD